VDPMNARIEKREHVAQGSCNEFFCVHIVTIFCSIVLNVASLKKTG
jgi:hypothetical protein